MSTEKRRLSMDLPKREWDLIDQLAEEKAMTSTQVVRQAVRLYQLVHEKAKEGKPLYFGETPVILL